MIVACLDSQTGGQGYANGIRGRHTPKRKDLPNAAHTLDGKLGTPDARQTGCTRFM
jgi:hypothetical protein